MTVFLTFYRNIKKFQNFLWNHRLQNSQSNHEQKSCAVGITECDFCKVWKSRYGNTNKPNMLVNDWRTQKQTHQPHLTDFSEETQNSPQYSGCGGNWVPTNKSIGYTKVLMPTHHQRNEEYESCSVASSKEEMSTCFPARKLRIMVVFNQLVTFASCRVRPHPNSPECLSDFLFLDLHLQSCFLVNRNHFLWERLHVLYSLLTLMLFCLEIIPDHRLFHYRIYFHSHMYFELGFNAVMILCSLGLYCTRKLLFKLFCV